MAFQKGDKVRLIDKFYEHPDFKAMSRTARKHIASYRGTVVRYYPCYTVPVSLLEPVPTERLVKRHALPGERIRIVAAGFSKGTYKNGDTFTVSRDFDSRAVKVTEPLCPFIHDSEYLVIEPTTPALHAYTPDQIREARDIVYTALIGNDYGVAYNAAYYRFTVDERYKITYAERIAIQPKITSAKCSPNDEWNADIGRMVAICKMTGRALPEWIK